jgi:hypothetical protein
MKFVWMTDLSVPGSGRLALTDTGATMRRIDLMHTKMPVFGSWLIEYAVRDPANDQLIVGLTPTMGQDPTVAASASYWIKVYNSGGGFWRTSLYLANGAQIDAADCPAVAVAGDRGKVLLTHHPDGSWQVYSYLRSLNSWYWSAASPVDVGALSSNYVTVAPRGAYVERITRYQGEMLPSELESQLP